MVMVEVPEPEMARPQPPPTFSAAFAAPSLRWPPKKRLRCSYPAASSPLRFPPSCSPLRCISPSPPLDAVPTRNFAATSAEPPPAHSPGSPYPPLSPTPSDRPRFLIRLPRPRRVASPRDEDGEPPPPLPTDLSSVAPTEVARGGGEEEAVGRFLRSSSRRAGGEEEKRRVELWVPLSRGEVEEDFLQLTGSKPPRRCRLRRRMVWPDRLSGVFPGSWLPNRITTDRYKVAEPSNPMEGEEAADTPDYEQEDH